MTCVVVVSHGQLSKEIVNSAQMILGGKYENVFSICLEESGLCGFKKEASKIAESIKGSNLIILADIYGGSPLNECLSIFRNFNYIAVTGVNLAMLIEVLTSRESMTLEELAKLAVDNGIAAIKNISLNSTSV